MTKLALRLVYAGYSVSSGVNLGDSTSGDLDITHLILPPFCWLCCNYACRYVCIVDSVSAAVLIAERRVISIALDALVLDLSSFRDIARLFRFAGHGTSSSRRRSKIEMLPGLSGTDLRLIIYSTLYKLRPLYPTPEWYLWSVTVVPCRCLLSRQSRPSYVLLAIS